MQNNLNFVQRHLDRLTDFCGFDFFCASDELKNTDHLCKEVEDKVRNVKGFHKAVWEHPIEFGLYRLALFAIVKSLKPMNVVETGVLHGFTTMLILEAMNQNSVGQLISVDLPSPYGAPPANVDGYNDTLPMGCSSGWIVPKRLRSNWNLVVGSSRLELPKLNFDGDLDLFIHDSDHTYENMMFEFSFAWNELRPGGVLVVDNIESNNALPDFSTTVERPVMYLPSDPTFGAENAVKARVGIMIK